MLLAELSIDEFAELYPAAGVPEASLDAGAVATLRRELTIARRRGYAVNKGQTERGIAAVAACVRDGEGAAVGANSVSVPTVRYASNRVPEMARAMRVATEAIAKGLR